MPRPRFASAFLLAILLGGLFTKPLYSEVSVSNSSSTEREKQIEVMALVQKLTDEGLRHQSTGQFEKAVEKYQTALTLAKSLSLAPKTTAVIFSLLGTAYVNLGRWPEVVEAATQAIHLKPDLAEVHQMLGFAYNELGRSQDAIRAYKEAIRLKPVFAEAHHGSGVVYKKLGHHEKAIAAFQEAIQAKPAFVFSHVELGATYVEMFENEGRRSESSGQIDRAIEQYRIALEKCQVALEAVKALQYDGGARYLSTLAVGLLTTLGDLSGKKEQFKEAANFYRQAAQFNQETGNTAGANTLTTYAAMQEGFDRLKTADSSLQGGRNQDAIQAFSDAADIFKQVENVALAAGALNRIAQIYKEGLNDNENALTYYEQALELCQQKDLSLEAQIRQSIGNLFVAMNQGKKALPFLKRAAELHEATNNLNPASGAFFTLGNVYQKQGQLDQALENFEKALQIEQKLESGLSQEMKSPHFYFKGMLLAFAGKAQEDLGQVEKAIEFYRRSSEALGKSGNKYNESLAFMVLGRSHVKLGRYGEALRLYERGQKVAREQKDWKTEVAALNALAMLADILGDVDKNKDYLLKTYELYQHHNEPQQAAIISVRIGRSYQDRSHYDEALSFYHQALSIYREAKDRGGEGRTLAQIGTMYRAIGDLDVAERWSKEAVEKSRMADDAIGELQALSTLIVVDASRGDNGALDSHFLQALKIGQDDRPPAGGIVGEHEPSIMALLNNFSSENFETHEKVTENVTNTIAEIAKQRNVELPNPPLEKVTATGDLVQALNQNLVMWGNRPDLAIPALTISLVFHRKFQSREDSHKAVRDLYLLGVAYLRMGRYDEALKVLREAEVLVRSSDSPDMWRVWAIEGAVAEKQGQLADASLSYTKAVEALESVSSQQRLEELKLPLREEASQLYRAIVRLLLQFSSEKNKRQRIEEAFLYHERGKARTLLDLLEEARVRIHEGIDPALSKEEEQITARILGVRRSLATPTLPKDYENALLSTLKEQEQALQALRVKMTVANPKYASLRSPQIATIPQIQELLDEQTLFLEYALGEERSFLWGVTKDNVQVYELPAEQAVSQLVEQYLRTLRAPLVGKGEIKEHRELGATLYQLLLRPAATQLQGKSKLVIVPDSSVNSFPFEALIADNSEGADNKNNEQLLSVPYLVKNYTVTYSPSASVLVMLEKARALHSQRASSPGPLLAFGDPSPMPDGFNRLTHSAEEVQKIAGIVGMALSSDAVNLQEKATKKHLREMDLSRYRMLHFATHAVLSEPVQRITQPALVLSSAGTDSPYDSFLQMGEIFNLRLNADLVVLSACDTGRGKTYRGEGVVGLTRSFMYAGTPSVVASLWRVSDESTSRFMEFFYRNLKEGRPKAEALRLAKIELMQTLVWNDQSQDEFPKFQSPYFWAPFILMGSGN